jgi:transcriptional regulator with XRE-family HTH domain
MKFHRWIESQGGPKEVARLLGTESPTVYAWLRGAASPKVLTIQKLIKLSKGKLTFYDIVNATKSGVR